jgi:hypothetical protein
VTTGFCGSVAPSPGRRRIPSPSRNENGGSRAPTRGEHPRSTISYPAAVGGNEFDPRTGAGVIGQTPGHRPDERVSTPAASRCPFRTGSSRSGPPFTATIRGSHFDHPSEEWPQPSIDQLEESRVFGGLTSTRHWSSIADPAPRQLRRTGQLLDADGARATSSIPPSIAISPRGLVDRNPVTPAP